MSFSICFGNAICSDVFLVYFETFGSSPISECLTKISLGSEEPNMLEPARVKERRFILRHSTEPSWRKYAWSDRFSLILSLSFPLSLWPLGFLISCPYFMSVPLSSLQTGDSVRISVSFPSSYWLAHDFGWLDRIFNADTIQCSLHVFENVIDPVWALCRCLVKLAGQRAN